MLKAGNPIIGDWDKETVRLDFDDTLLSEVKLWSYRACLWFHLDGFIVFQSSMKNYIAKRNNRVFYRFRKGSYLVVFDRSVHWDTNVKIMNWVGLESGNLNLQKYVRMQCIKKTSTVRISNKGNKPIPKIVFRFGNQNRQIKKFLETRTFILSFLEQQEKELV
jgi:hypothetical protein